MPKEDLVINSKAVEEMIRVYGKRTLLMGTLKEDGSLSIPWDCYMEAAPLLNGSSLLAYRTGPQTVNYSAFIDKVGEARKRKVATLTKALQNAPNEDEAKKYWRRLEHLMFGN
jgi:hypothetical protein